MSTLDGYRTERDAYVASVNPACRFAAALTFAPFTVWCAARGIDPPLPDLADPTVARRFRAYQAWREGELSRLTPEARASVEQHMTAFLDWLIQAEVEEQYPNRKRKTK